MVRIFCSITCHYDVQCTWQALGSTGYQASRRSPLLLHSPSLPMCLQIRFFLLQNRAGKVRFRLVCDLQCALVPTGCIDHGN
jgi:hypothetical protein